MRDACVKDLLSLYSGMMRGVESTAPDVTKKFQNEWNKPDNLFLPIVNLISSGTAAEIRDKPGGSMAGTWVLLRNLRENPRDPA